MTTLRLEVEKAYPNDSGRGIARLDPDTFSRLEFTPGDYTKIKGNNTTAVMVWRADRQDWDTDTVRIDGFTRQNADVGLGEYVELRNTEVMKADSIILTSPAEAAVQFGSDATGIAKRQLLKRTVVEGDIVPVMSTEGDLFMRSPGQSISLVTVATEPEGAVRITPETSVIIQGDGESPN